MKIEMDRREMIGESASQQTATKDEEEGKDASRKRKETRKESDRNIRNYNKIAVLDDFGTDQPEQLTPHSLRGKIQNRNIMVDLLPPYGISFFPGDTLVHRVRYFERDVEELSDQFLFGRSVEITNVTKEPDREMSAAIFETISKLDQKIDTASSDTDRIPFLMERGLLYMDVLNLNNAIDNFNRIINIDPDHYIARFARAFTRYKMVQTVNEMSTKEIQDEDPMAVSEAGDELSQQTILDYNMIIDDLEKVVEIEPEFEFAWFNLGYMSSVLRNFEEAVEFYSKAIEKNSDFAEAYFNRGLVRIFLGKTSEGTLDLSKAGELGVYEAYSVIKRYGSYEVEQNIEEKEEQR
jgi:tetratricopeptide (TPR) repeat protein